MVARCELTELVSYANKLMDIDVFEDYAPNGLQLEGAASVTKLVSGVTASLALIEAAVEAEADVLLVHHGYFWRSEDACITGIKKRRIKKLLENDVSLLAYHLPLDAHPLYGNNAQLAKILGLVRKPTPESASLPAWVSCGELSRSMLAHEFSQHLEKILGRTPLHLPGGDEKITRIAWCTGGAQSYFEQLAKLGFDAYLSGEVSEQTTHIAREYGVHYFAAGHHATERYGVQALAEHLKSHFEIEHQFIDIENPV